MALPFRYSICNEAYQGREFAAACRHMRAAGYTGIEIAPMTLAEDPATLPAPQRREYARIIRDEGLTFVGLHWVMVAPKGLHVTTPDVALRTRSWLHIRNLIDLCADFGPDGVMVFGSPLQRCSTGGATSAEATARFVEGLASVADHAAGRGVRVLVEALSPSQSDVVTSLAEAVAIVRQIGSPGVRTMFDTHNAVDEKEPHAALVERYFEWIAHIHVNENDGKHCGAGDYDFFPLLETLQRLDYRGWISLEAFDFSYTPEQIASGSITHLKNLASRLPPVCSPTRAK